MPTREKHPEKSETGKQHKKLKGLGPQGEKVKNMQIFSAPPYLGISTKKQDRKKGKNRYIPEKGGEKH